MAARAPQFTPGPWKVFYGSAGHMLGIGVDRPADEDHAMGVTDAYGGLWGSGGEKEANARLIAAAPELYEALEWARDAVHSAYCDDDHDADAPELSDAEIDEGKAPIHCEECREATAALAKARGDQ